MLVSDNEELGRSSEKLVMSINGKIRVIKAIAPPNKLVVILCVELFTVFLDLPPASISL